MMLQKMKDEKLGVDKRVGFEGKEFYPLLI